MTLKEGQLYKGCKFGHELKLCIMTLKEGQLYKGCKFGHEFLIT
jgi:hypothetical protein